VARSSKMWQMPRKCGKMVTLNVTCNFNFRNQNILFKNLPFLSFKFVKTLTKISIIPSIVNYRYVFLILFFSFSKNIKKQFAENGKNGENVLQLVTHKIMKN
jgi:hypothetical protein